MHGRVEFDEPLARATSLRVGGPVDALVRIDSRAELARVVALARAHGVAVHVLGGGFNTLARDAGLRAVALRLTGLRKLALAPDGSLLAEAGATQTQIARFCAEHGRAGLEFAVGIPGTVGGWIAMNAGVHGREMKDVVTEVELFAPESGGCETHAVSALGLRYRGASLPAGAIVVAARFATSEDSPLAIRARQKELMAKRRASQPVDQPSCGSVFVNPPNDFAGRLIEAAGLKGTRIGGARISELHANFIVTDAGARAADVEALIARAHAAVLAQFGIALETEVRRLGDAA